MASIQRDSHLTQDYSHSKAHRYSVRFATRTNSFGNLLFFQRTGVDVRKIYPPGQTLHLSNIPCVQKYVMCPIAQSLVLRASDSDEAVRDVFLKLGFSVEKFQRFK